MQRYQTEDEHRKAMRAKIDNKERKTPETNHPKIE